MKFDHFIDHKCIFHEGETHPYHAEHYSYRDGWNFFNWGKYDLNNNIGKGWTIYQLGRPGFIIDTINLIIDPDDQTNESTTLDSFLYRILATKILEEIKAL